MFNWFGNMKIGILGSAGSGKTMLLTSLLWHLQEHDNFRFAIGKKRTQLTDFELEVHRSHDFGFQGVKNRFVQQQSWPVKTQDYTVASCRYKRSDVLCERKLVFVDIPGERVSDVLISQSQSFQEWSEAIFRFWREDPRIESCMAPFLALVQSASCSPKELVDAYKRSLRSLLSHWCPVTPSTFFLNTQGKTISKRELEDDDLLQDWPIWEGGDFVPLSLTWKAVNSQFYQECLRSFKRYRKEVVAPLYSEINDCDHLIVCVDIFAILMTGPSLFHQTRQEISTFFNRIKPGKLGALLNKLGRNPPRVVFVATKADLVQGDDLDRLRQLLFDFVRPLRTTSVRMEVLTCSACISIEKKMHEGKWRFVGSDPCIQGHKICFEMNKPLPDIWPASWNHLEYNFHEVAPRISIATPPAQSNLNKIFDFITEGKPL